MTIDDIHQEGNCMQDTEVQFSILNANNEEEIISLGFEELSYDENEDKIIINLFDVMAQIDADKQVKLIQSYMNRVPEELRTDENFELMKIMFDF